MTRNITIDVMKGIAMILVILDHSGTPLVPVLDHIEVPIFFLISGYFFSTRAPFMDFLRKKVMTLVVPYFIFALLFGLPYICFHHVSGLKEFLIDVLVRPANGPLWFLKALFWALLYYYYIAKIVDQYKWPLSLLLSVALAIIVAYIMMRLGSKVPETILWTGLMQGLIALPLLSFGHLARRLMPFFVVLIDRTRHPIALNVTIASIAAIGAYITGIDSIQLHMLNIGQRAWAFYPCALFSGIAFAYFCNLLTSIKPFVYIGRQSLAYFGIHYLVIFIVIEIIILPWLTMALLCLIVTTPLVIIWHYIYPSGSDKN